MSIFYRRGDLFTQDVDAYAHGCNCRGLMGAGIAAQFRERFPAMYQVYRLACDHGELTTGRVLPWADDGKIIFNLMTQREPGPCAEPWAIAAAIGQMIQLARLPQYRAAVIGLPEIGCGIGGLTPARLKACLQPYRAAPVHLVVVRYAP